MVKDSMPPWIYVSYHRDGYAAWAAGKIANGLDRLLGPCSAFIDEYGRVGTEVWQRTVEAALGQSAVLLAVITESWHASLRTPSRFANPGSGSRDRHTMVETGHGWNRADRAHG